MSEPVGPSLLAIAPGDRRVFLLAISSTEGEIDHQTHLSRLQDGALDPAGLAHFLGVDDIRPEAVEVFAIKDIEAMGLMSYLQQAYDIPQAALQADWAKLSALGGDVMVLGPGALGRVGQTLEFPPSLRMIGAYGPEEADNAPRPMAAPDIAPITHTTPPAPAASIPRWLIWSLVLKILLIIAIIALVIRL